MLCEIDDVDVYVGEQVTILPSEELPAEHLKAK